MNTISMGEDIGTKINQNFGLNSNNFKLLKKQVRLGYVLIALKVKEVTLVTINNFSIWGMR